MRKLIGRYARIAIPKISVRYAWDKRPEKQAEYLTKSMRNTACRKSLNKAAVPIKSAVLQNSPVAYGLYRKSVRIKTKNYRKGDRWVAIVGAKSDFKGKRKGRKSKILYRPGRYQHLLEMKTGFLSRARAQSLPEFNAIFAAKLKSELAAILPR